MKNKEYCKVLFEDGELKIVAKQKFPDCVAFYLYERRFLLSIPYWRMIVWSTCEYEIYKEKDRRKSWAPSEIFDEPK